MSAPDTSLVLDALRYYVADGAASSDEAPVIEELCAELEAGRYGLVLVAPPVDGEKCHELGDTELTRNALRHAAHRAELGGHHTCAQRTRTIADRLEGAVVDELFGQTAEGVRKQWLRHEQDMGRTVLAGRYVENYPRGAADDAPLAHELYQHGGLYALNAAVLYPLGFALGALTHHETGDAFGLMLVDERTSDGGPSFDELAHEVGAGRLRRRELDAVLTGLRELEARLKTELDRRHGAYADAPAEEVDAAVLVELGRARAQFKAPVGRGFVGDALGLTRSQLSASLERLGKAGLVQRVTVDGETAYDLTVDPHEPGETS